MGGFFDGWLSASALAEGIVNQGREPTQQNSDSGIR